MVFSECNAMRRIGLIVVPDVQIINFAALSVFELANAKSGELQYDLVVMSECGGNVRSSFGMDISTEPLDSGLFDTILMASSMEPRSATPKLISYLRGASEMTRRLVSISVSAFTFGEAGLLRNRRATTHWAFSTDLQRRFPDAKIETDRIFLSDGQIWTSAGMTACIDLALAMVESDLGQDVARVVARSLILSDRRTGGQSQHSALLDVANRSDRVQRALAFARQHLDEPLSNDRLAAVACLSPRQFTRVFRGETGRSPAKVIEKLRLEKARFLLEQGRLPVEVIAKEAGFGDRERMRRAFLRSFGQPPQALRKNAGPMSAW
jgi:transcriptional regulator GlxA family with amidase domain